MKKVKTYDFVDGRQVYIRSTVHSPIYWRQNGKGNGFDYKGPPYRVLYVDDNTLAIDGMFCRAALAKESIEHECRIKKVCGYAEKGGAEAVGVYRSEGGIYSHNYDYVFRVKDEILDSFFPDIFWNQEDAERFAKEVVSELNKITFDEVERFMTK